MTNELIDNFDFITLDNNIDDLDYIIGRMEYKWRLDKDIEYHMRQDSSWFRKSPKSHALLPEIPRTEFDCRIINNPIELMKMGYAPSKNCWSKFYESDVSQIHANDYDIDEEYENVAWRIRHIQSILNLLGVGNEKTGYHSNNDDENKNKLEITYENTINKT